MSEEKGNNKTRITNALFFAVLLLLSTSNAFKLSGRKAMRTVS
jgi:hypothetical protein